MRAPRRALLLLVGIHAAFVGAAGCTEPLTVAEERDASRAVLASDDAAPMQTFSDGAPPPSDAGADARDVEELHDPIDGGGD